MPSLPAPPQSTRIGPDEGLKTINTCPSQPVAVPVPGGWDARPTPLHTGSVRPPSPARPGRDAGAGSACLWFPGLRGGDTAWCPREAARQTSAAEGTHPGIQPDALDTCCVPPGLATVTSWVTDAPSRPPHWEPLFSSRPPPVPLPELSVWGHSTARHPAAETPPASQAARWAGTGGVTQGDPETRGTPAGGDGSCG